MLLQFKTKNYKSFADEVNLSLLPAPKQKGLDYSLLSQEIKGQKVKALSSSVIYGPNASGKTNIIGAIDTFRAIVLRGNIRNSEEKSTPNVASYNLELIPNNTQSLEPVLFDIEYLDGTLKIRYCIHICFGEFLDSTYKRKIIREELHINDEMVFCRKEELSFGKLKNIKEYLSSSTERPNKSIFDIAQRSLNDEELFLTNGFKLIISQELVKRITDWFSNKLMVIYRADSINMIQRFTGSQKKTIDVSRGINNSANVFGIHANDLDYVSNDDETEIKLCSIFKDLAGNTRHLPADVFESFGTIRFINIFPLVIRAIMTGGTLIIDEFDASIHPMALMSIINVFHNDDLNMQNAQLIFNTHNPIFLNSNIFRRDEIKFVERDDETHGSSLYSLSDFGTTGKNGVRSGDDYMKNYFVNRYGGIKDVDFSPLFEELLKGETEL